MLGIYPCRGEEVVAMHQKSVELADPWHDYPRVSAMVDCTVEWVIQFEYNLTCCLVCTWH